MDCVVGDWSGWSRCTKGCGGGSRTRDREVLTPEENQGEPCPATSGVETCNTGSCDADCVLDDWAAWGACSRSCRYPGVRPGHQYRERHMRIAVRGQGTCPSPGSAERLQYRSCNDALCPDEMKCLAPLDMILVLDGSGTLYNDEPGREDANWKAEKELAKLLTSARR